MAALRDSVRPSPGTVILGQTTHAEIVRRYGRPSNEETAFKNGADLKILLYSLTELRPGGARGGVIPQRMIVFDLFGDVVVGYAWASSHLEDSTDFDETKRFRLTKGQATRAEVVALLGEPTGQYRYPLVTTRDGIGLVYLHQQTRILPGLKLVSETKSLVVVLDAGDIVTDLRFETNVVPVPLNAP